LVITVGIDNGDDFGIADDGVLQTGEVDQTSYLCTSYVPKRVFVSSSLSDGALGGLAAADTNCQALANAAGLGGSYKAWLSDATGSPSTRFTHSLLPYALVDGTQIAANWAALTSGSLSHAIDLTETSGSYTDYVYSATNSDGTYFGSADCDGWTSGSSIDTAMVGYSPDANQWSHVGIIGCDANQGTYCFEQ
jgi:hypothetical protein